MRITSFIIAPTHTNWDSNRKKQNQVKKCTNLTYPITNIKFLTSNLVKLGNLSIIQKNIQLYLPLLNKYFKVFFFKYQKKIYILYFNWTP